MENQKGEGDYQKLPIIPKDVSSHDIRNHGSKLIKILINHALFSDPSKRNFYDSLKKREQERRLYGDLEDFGSF